MVLPFLWKCILWRDNLRDLREARNLWRGNLSGEGFMKRQWERIREGSSRRDFLKAAGIMGTMAIAGRTALREATAQMPAITSDPRLVGGIDMHVHSAPDVFADR